MVSLQKVNTSMFDRVYPLLQELDPQLKQNCWQFIFQPPWTPEEDYCGYGLFDGDVAVGFVGLIFSQRKIDGKLERFCNVTSWIVKESYRGQSMLLMFPLMQLKDYTLTDLSAERKIFPLLARMGFKPLDTKIKLSIPIPLARDRRLEKSARIVADAAQIRTLLNGDDRQVFEDHQGIEDCHHLLVDAGDRRCHVVYTHNRKGRIPYCYLQFASDRQLFADCSLLCRRYIARQHRTPFILVDSRFGDALPWAFDLPLQFTKLYKSERLQPQQIDNLYAELVLLNFNLLPSDLKTAVRALFHRADPYPAS
ncbi:hypothetical protein [Altericista sp. CCNU0014]|uniref:hypothetical protein n=1 Tax=Altericista sp. CCNU0014 TaxID=3082949 RepID=UPI00384DDB40